MPILLEAESIPPEDRYSDDHPVPLKKLRRSAPRVFAALRRAYRAYAKVEAAVTPRTALDPVYHLRRLKAEIPRPPRRIVLDVGGGAAPYRSVLDGGSDTWVVLEKDPDHAAELVEKGSGADYLVGAGEKIPLLDATCDIVVLTEVLEHCNRPQDVLGEIARVLKPGGLCIGTVPQYWHLHGWPSDYFRYTNHGLAYLAGESGLTVRRMQPKGGPLLLIWGVLDLTTSRWSRLPGIALLVRIPTLWIASALDRLLYRNPLRMTYPDTAGWAFLFEKPAAKGR
jgi:SAM-dependent methyltransferase